MSPDHRALVNALQTPENNTNIYQTFAETGQLDQELIARAMAKVRNMPIARVGDIDPEKANIIGTGLDGVVVFNDVAYMVNPFDSRQLHDLQKRLERGEIRYRHQGVISLSDFKDPRFSRRLDQSDNDESVDLEYDESTAKMEAENLITQIIQSAYDRKATDIHIAGTASPARGDVRIRVDGKLRPLRTFPIELYRPLSTILHDKTKSQVADPSLPHSADFEEKCSDGKVLTLRLESIEHQAGRKYWRKLSLRIMGAGGTFGSIKGMGFSEANEKRLLSVTRRPTGLFLVTGPTGSGKSTTLGSMLSTMHTAAPDKAYYSIENPVEVEHKGVYQIPIKGNLTFEQALESIMRHDPDVVLVGEIRSELTAQLAIQASLTGHVVLATLHTNDSHGVIPRLKHFGISSVDLAESLIGSSGQRLVPKLCPHCSIKKPFSEIRAGLLASIPALEFIKPEWIGDEELVHERKNGGCDRCNGSGINGRVPVTECFLADSSVREALLRGDSGIELRRSHITSKHMEPMWSDAFRLLKRGEVSLEEIFRVLDESDLQDFADLSH